MPPARRPWFRFYVEAVDDPKVLRLSDTEFRVWVNVLAIARRSCEPGRLMLAAGVPMVLADVAHQCRKAEKVVAGALASMIAVALLAVDEAGVWYVPSWKARQFESDDEAQRASKRRSMQHRNDGRCNTVTTVDAPSPETETENRVRNPLTPTADAVGEPVEKSERTPTPRRGMRGSGTSPREVRHAERRAEAERSLDVQVAEFARLHAAQGQVSEVSFAALERWPHQPEVRTRALEAWGRLRQ